MAIAAEDYPKLINDITMGREPTGINMEDPEERKIYESLKKDIEGAQKSGYVVHTPE